MGSTRTPLGTKDSLVHTDRPSLGQLVSTLSEKLSQLVRDEIKLAQVELKAKGQKAAAGAGLFAVAGVLAFFAFGALIAAAILGLANVVPAWLAALIVAVALLIIAAILGAAGKASLDRSKAAPLTAQASVKADVAAIKEGLQS